MISLDDLLADINITLSAFLIPYKKVSLGHNFPSVFVINELGVVVVGIDPSDYTYILNKLISQFKGYRYIFISTAETVFAKKDEILWELMRSGYIRYIRYKYTRQFNNLIQQGFGQKIITERLKIWGDQPKYRYLVEENKRCLHMSAPYLVTVDPAFFDFMPEKPTGEENV